MTNVSPLCHTVCCRNETWGLGYNPIRNGEKNVSVTAASAVSSNQE